MRPLADYAPLGPHGLIPPSTNATDWEVPSVVAGCFVYGYSDDRPLELESRAAFFDDAVTETTVTPIGSARLIHRSSGTTGERTALYTAPGGLRAIGFSADIRTVDAFAAAGPTALSVLGELPHWDKAGMEAIGVSSLAMLSQGEEATTRAVLKVFARKTTIAARDLVGEVLGDLKVTKLAPDTLEALIEYLHDHDVRSGPRRHPFLLDVWAGNDAMNSLYRTLESGVFSGTAQDFMRRTGDSGLADATLGSNEGAFALRDHAFVVHARPDWLAPDEVVIAERGTLAVARSITKVATIDTTQRYVPFVRAAVLSERGLEHARRVVVGDNAAPKPPSTRSAYPGQPRPPVAPPAPTFDARTFRARRLEKKS